MLSCGHHPSCHRDESYQAHSVSSPLLWFKLGRGLEFQMAGTERRFITPRSCVGRATRAGDHTCGFADAPWISWRPSNGLALGRGKGWSSDACYEYSRDESEKPHYAKQRRQSQRPQHMTQIIQMSRKCRCTQRVGVSGCHGLGLGEAEQWQMGTEFPLEVMRML